MIGAAAWGGIIFLDRHKNKELITPTAPKTTETEKADAEPVKAPSFDKTKYSLSDPASIWVVVNKNRPLSPLSYVPADLVSVGDNAQMRQEAAVALKKLRDAASSEDVPLSEVISGYRSYTYQTGVYNSYVKKDGEAKANTYSARPGYSEHQTGWATDLGTGTCDLQICFGETAAGKWLAAHAYEYGFIVRYTAGKESVTGYQAEPWHIRYIGTELATEMHAENIVTLEEFFDVK